MKSVTKLGRTMPAPPPPPPAAAEVNQVAVDAIRRKFHDTLEVSGDAQPWKRVCGGCIQMRDRQTSCP
eukprot:scaffold5312_cov118-Isochrysis_galbana.AAC.16